MSKTSDALRAIGIVNTYDTLTKYSDDLATPMPVAVIYRTQDLGRMTQLAAWQVYRPGCKTDPEAHWQDYDKKTFTVFTPKSDKAPRLEEAKAWASERYDVTEWVTIAGMRGDWFPAEVGAWVKRMLKDAGKS